MPIPRTKAERALMWAQMKDWLNRTDPERDAEAREFLDLIAGRSSFARQTFAGMSFKINPNMPANGTVEFRDPLTGAVVGVIIGIDLAREEGQ